MKAGKQDWNKTVFQYFKIATWKEWMIESNKQIYQPIMNGSNMENEKTPLYVAFSTQKGGVGKTTFTVLAASYLY